LKFYSEPYCPRDVKTGNHPPLKLRYIERGETGQEFRWRRVSDVEFKTIEDAKNFAREWLEDHPEMVPYELREGFKREVVTITIEGGNAINIHALTSAIATKILELSSYKKPKELIVNGERVDPKQYNFERNRVVDLFYTDYRLNIIINKSPVDR
jgi:hypothetical protein